MNYNDAIILAEEYLSPAARKIVKLSFAKFVPANSTELLDPKLPDDTWEVFFDFDKAALLTPDGQIEREFVAVYVNCRTKEAQYPYELWLQG